MEKLLNRIKQAGGLLQFIKFGMVGLSNTIVSYVVYSFFVFIGVHYVIANCISFFAGTLNSYFWNNRYVFKLDEGQKRNHFCTFMKVLMSYAFTGVVLNNILSIILIEEFQVSKYLAPIFIAIISVPLNFILNKFWAMRVKKS